MHGAQKGLRGQWAKLQFRFALKHAAGVLLEREADCTLMAAYAPALHDRLFVLPPLAAPRTEGSFDTGTLHALYPNLRFLLLTIAGHATDAATMKQTLAVFSELASIYPWIGLIILAPHERRKEADTAAQRSPHHDRIDVRDFASSYDLGMRGADALLLLAEHSETVAHLHMAAQEGLPIVTTRANANEAGLLHDVSCLAPMPADASAVVASVRSLVEHNEVRHRIAIGGRTAVPRKPSLDEAAWSSALSEVLDKSLANATHV